jgi:hypothetical protein
MEERSAQSRTPSGICHKRVPSFQHSKVPFCCLKPLTSNIFSVRFQLQHPRLALSPFLRVVPLCLVFSSQCKRCVFRVDKVKGDS